MRKFYFLLLSIALVSCSDEKTGGDSNDGASGKPESSDGTLYMRTTMFGTTLNIAWFWLGDDGVIVRDPVAGVNPIDLAIEKEKNASQTGTYRLNDGKMEVQWSDGKTSSWSYEKENDRFVGIDGGIVTVPKAMPSGYKLNGSFTAHEVVPNASAVTTMRFNEDGTFSYQSTGAVTMPDESAQSSVSDRGTYTIEGNTLTIKFGDGKVEKSLINILDLGGSQYLIINQGRFPANQ